MQYHAQQPKTRASSARAQSFTRHGLFPRSTSAFRWALALLLPLAALLLCRTSHAQASPADRAAAEALFEQGMSLMESGQAAQACGKFEASQKLDPGVGTLLYLADCYETVGRTASAWATFLQASYAAQNAGQTDRQELAESNAARLKPILSNLELRVEPSELPGIVVTSDGQVVAKATWGTAIPVDPGEHEIVASADGKQSFRTTLIIPAGPGTTTLTIPALEDAPVETPPPPAASPAAAAAPTLPAATSPTTPHDEGSAQRTWGWISLLSGGAALAGGGLFAFLAVSDNGRADDQCRRDDPARCGERGVELGESAAQKANVASVLGGVGGVLAITGAVLILTAEDGSEAARLGMATDFATRHTLQLEGTW